MIRGRFEESGIQAGICVIDMASALSPGEDEELSDCHPDARDRPGADGVAGFDVPRIIVAIPAYNEEVAIGSLVLRTVKYADEVVVIDDGSADHTSEVARLAGARVIAHAENEGKGAGIRDAFAYARDSGAGILVLMDGDGQHDPDSIPMLIRPILERKADLVNGSRFLAGSGNSVPGYRRIGQSILNAITNAGTRRNITDTQNGFRAFSKKTFGCFSFSQNGMAIESEMLIEAADAKMRITEVPINVRYDVQGSTYNPITHGLDVLSKVVGLVSQRRPGLFICLPGAIMIGLGIACTSILASTYNMTHSLTVEYASGAMLFVFLGTSLLSTGLTMSAMQKPAR